MMEKYLFPMDMIVILMIAVILLIAVITDIRHRKIPNILTLGAMIISITYHSWGRGFDGFAFSFLGLISGMALLIAFYIMGGMGAGDVKLMGAVGGFLGPKGILYAFIFSALAGGIYALVILYLRGCLMETLKRYGLMIKILLTTGSLKYVPYTQNEIKNIRLSYGIAIGLGTMGSILIKHPF